MLNNMDDLIEALQIFRRYTNERYPLNCVHDVLLVTCVSKEEVMNGDYEKLNKLGFDWMEEYEAWGSFRFGSN